MLTGASRRFFLGSCAATAVGVANSHWLAALATEREREPAKVERIILLWLHGGPATIDLWDLKPQNANGGPFSEIKTQTPGTRISEHLPGLAKWTNDMAIIRSMTSREGDHDRAVHFTRTGYKPQAGVDFPDLGAIVASERAKSEQSLPNFVSIAPPQRPAFAGNGFLPPSCSPMRVGEQAQSIQDLAVSELKPPQGMLDSANMRFDLLKQFNNHFVAGHDHRATQTFQGAADRAIGAMNPQAAAAFDLTAEKSDSRQRYGINVFGQGCLLARRLIEQGVSFVEVALDGWDTHSDNFNRVASLSRQLDQAFAALLEDLSNRGMLSSTLVICQGEFGRTPKINGNVGRDHWPKSWSVALAGGGVGRGQLIGETSADGTEIKTDPYVVPDLIATICDSAGIDPRKQNMSNVNRPIRVADPDAGRIGELL
ncbi:MAG: DUF1501 domain-containing protein [bacterium]|nr:DUF1501 domain-containing protein [bacterium]